MNKRQQITIAERTLDNAYIEQTTRQLLAQTLAQAQLQQASGEASAIALAAAARVNTTTVRADAEAVGYVQARTDAFNMIDLLTP
jgi:hypothetical protein